MPDDIDLVGGVEEGRDGATVFGDEEQKLQQVAH
jgi:hypothetical protein